MSIFLSCVVQFVIKIDVSRDTISSFHMVRWSMGMILVSNARVSEF